MAPPKRPWFRFYVEAIWDPKLRRLSPAHRWLWATVMAMARVSPVPGALLADGTGEPLTDTEIADASALKIREVRAGIRAFVEAEMLTRTDDGILLVTKWDKRQFESDDVAKRTARHRAKNANETPNGTFQQAPMERSMQQPCNGDPRVRARDREQRTDTPSSRLQTQGVARETDDDDLMLAIAQARATRLGRHNPTPAWLASTASSLDRRRALALAARGLTVQQIDHELDRPTRHDGGPITTKRGTFLPGTGWVAPPARAGDPL